VTDQGPDHPQDQPPPAWPPPPQQSNQQGYEQPNQQAYQQPAYGTEASDQIRFQPSGPMLEHPQATLAFVLGLLSVLGLTILGPFGWYLGNKIVGEIDRDGRVYRNRGLAMAGKVLGIIGTVFLGLTVLGIILVIVIAIVAAGSSSSVTSGY
jgi:hypothetical protein